MSILGIDLGTSNSLVGYWNTETHETMLIPNALGNFLTPSIVCVNSNDEITIGEVAKQNMTMSSYEGAKAFKRFMGTNKVYKMGSYSFKPEELSAIILKKLKEDAEVYLGESCDTAIISVPAYFNNNQREATIEAAKLAGLKVLQLISEPTAAALSYGINRQEEADILVIDIGGGTYDVSLLEMFDGIMQVKAIAGDNQLGGEDFTRELVKDFYYTNDLKSEDFTGIEQRRIFRKFEEAKCSFELVENCEIEIDHREKTYEYIITEDKLIKLWDSLLKKIRQPIIKVINDGNIQLNEIDKVILIGGTTRSTIVRQYISKLLGKIPYTQINPDEAVGLGASVQTALRELDEMIDEMILTDVCGFSLGVDYIKEIGSEKKSGYFMPIIQRNSSLPISRMSDFTTVYPEQTEVHFEIYQGESMYVSDNLKIGEINVNVPPGEIREVQVRFTYDINGLLEVEVYIPITHQTKKVMIYNSSKAKKMNAQEIAQQSKKLAELKIHPRDKEESKLLLARIERIFQESTIEIRNLLVNLESEFQAALEKQDALLVSKKAKKIHAILDEIEQRNGF